MNLKVCHRCCTNQPEKDFQQFGYGAMCLKCAEIFYEIHPTGDVTAESSNLFEQKLDEIHGVKRYNNLKKGDKLGEWVVKGKNARGQLNL